MSRHNVCLYAINSKKDHIHYLISIYYNWTVKRGLTKMQEESCFLLTAAKLFGYNFNQ